MLNLLSRASLPYSPHILGLAIRCLVLKAFAVQGLSLLSDFSHNGTPQGLQLKDCYASATNAYVTTVGEDLDTSAEWR